MVQLDIPKIGREVFEVEIDALHQTKMIIGENFEVLVNVLLSCEGKIIISGMGKSGHIGRKIAATFSSLGRPAFFLHPAEALHGDLGMISGNDVVIMISNSGENRELIHMLSSVKLIGAKTILITSEEKSTLAKNCDYVQVMPKVREACMLNLAPTSSTTAVLAYGDALAVTLSKCYNFTEKEFALFHPEGALGRRILTRVKDIMAIGDAIPRIRSGSKISDAIMEMSKKNLGMVIIVNKDNRLVGLLTDGDLRRAIEQKVDMYNGYVDLIMTKNPRGISADILAVQALQELKLHSINNYPVIDDNHSVVGALTWQMIIKNGIML